MSIPLDEFTARLCNSGLFTADELEDCLDGLPENERPTSAEKLAHTLVQSKRLTSYQAKALYQNDKQQLVLGNYVILDKLGQGGMGAVLKARHRRMQRVVALKVLSQEIVEDVGAIQRFHREVVAAARLAHPNIVTAYDADEAKGTHFLVMEYVEGRDLSNLVKSGGPLRVETAIAYVIQAARGLEYAHQQGVVHRDIKPSNLLLDANETVKILDMGLARVDSIAGDGPQAELTGTGAILGTVDYMAPEQAVSTKNADARADIYALGATLWYLLTGRAIYQGESMIAKLLAHRESPVPSLCQFLQDAPATLDATFRKMVAKQPQDRFQTMTAVLESLERSLPGSAAKNLSRDPEDSSEDVKLTEFFQSQSSGASGTKLNSATQFSPLPTVVAAASKELTDSEQTVTATQHIDTDPKTDQTLLLGVEQAASASQIRSQSARGKKRASILQRYPITIFGSVVVAAFATVVGTLLFLLSFGQGTVRIEAFAPGLEVVVLPTRTTIKGEGKQISLPPGKYSLYVKWGDVEFETDSFKVVEGENPPVRVLVQADQIKVVQDSATIGKRPLRKPSAATGPTAAERRATEKATKEAADKAAKLKDDAMKAANEKAAREADEKRSQGAKQAFPALEKKAQESGATFASFGQEVQAVQAQFGGTAEAVQAVELLMKFPSPLDALGPAKLPQDCLDDWKVMGREPPKELVAVLGANRQRHWGAVRSVAMSPTGKVIASAGDDRVIRLWDADTLLPRKGLVGHTDSIACLTFSNDGKQLLSGSADKTGRLWDVESGNLLAVLEGHTQPIHSVAFAADKGGLLTAANDYTVWRWDAANGMGAPEFPLMGAVFSSSGQFALGKEKDGMPFVVFDVAGKQKLRPLDGDSASLDSAVFSKDEKQILLSSSKDFTLRLLSVETGKELRRFEKGHMSNVLCLAMSLDGLQALSGSYDGTVRLWNVGTGKELTCFKGHLGPVRGVAFSGDGNRVLAGGDDGTMRVWDVKTGSEVEALSGALAGLAFSLDCTRLIVTGGHTARLWDIAKPEAPQTFDLGPRTTDAPAAFSPDGELLALGAQNHLELWDLKKNEMRHSLPGMAVDLSFSPGGKTVVSAEGSKTARAWDVVLGKRRTAYETPKANCVAFDRGGDRLFTGDADNAVRVFEENKGIELMRFDNGSPPLHMAFFPSGNKVLVASQNAALRCRDVKDWRQQWEQPGEHFAIGPDGQGVIIVAGQKLTLHDGSSGEPVETWQFPGPVRCVTFAADGRHIATANANGTVYILRLSPPPTKPAK